MMLSEISRYVKSFFSSLLSMDLGNVSSKKRRLFYFLQVLGHVTVQFQKDLGLQMSAALAYTTVLSLVPVSALLVLYTKVAGKLDHYSDSIQTWILKTFVADSAQGVMEYINSFIDNMHTRTLGTVGIAGLLITTYTLFKTIEKGFNRIWNIKKSRSSWATIQILSSLLIMVPALLAASFYLSGKMLLLHTAVQTFSFIVPFILTSLSLIFLFKLVPNTNVYWRSAAIAGFLSAIVFEMAKHGFNVYVAHVLPVNKIYGSLGLVPVFLIWIYFSWSIVLFGVELSFTIQNLHLLREERHRLSQGLSEKNSVHEDIAFQILKSIATEHFKSHQVVSISQIYDRLQFDRSVIEDHLDLLEKSQWIHFIEQENIAGYVFVRPAQSITRKDVEDLFRNHMGLAEKKDEKPTQSICD